MTAIVNGQTRLAEVLALAAEGFALFPVKAGVKEPPLINAFPTKASRDLAQLNRWAARWPGCNWAISTSVFSSGALLVVDVDDKNGKAGSETLRQLELEQEDLPRTRTATTPTGGRHLIFSVPVGVKTGVDALGSGLDTRSQGGYIICAPSTVPKGGYTMDDHPVVPAPDWLVALVGAAKEKDTAAGEILPGIDQAAALRDAIDYLQNRAPASVKGSGGDATAYRVICTVLDFGVAPSEVRELLFTHWYEGSGWSPERLQEKIDHALRYRKTAIGSANAAADFADLDVDALCAEIDAAQAAAAAAIAKARTAAPRLREVSLDDLATAVLKRRHFWLEGLLPEKALCLLGAHGGTGKSTLALTIAAHLACGMPFCGLAASKARVMYLSLEDDSDMVRPRLREACAAYGLDVSVVARGMRLVDGTEIGNLMVESSSFGTRGLAETEAMQDLREMAASVDVLIVDNASDAFGANENDRQSVRTFVRRLQLLVSGHGGAVLLLAHVGKDVARAGGSESYSGSTAWHNTARSRAAMSEDKHKVIRLVHEKSNYGKRVGDLAFTWADRNGIGVLMPLDAAAAQAVEDAQGRADASDVLLAIAESPSRIPCATAGSDTGVAALSRLLPDTFERKRISTALIRLDRERRIIRESIRTSSGNYRDFWKVA